MKNVSHKKVWIYGAVQIHAGPPHIPLIKSNLDMKLEKYYVRIKLRRFPTSQKSDMYEFRISLFENGEPEQFLLFQKKYKMMLDASGTLIADVKIQYLQTLLCGEALHEFDTLCVQIENTTTTHLNWILLGFGAYFLLLFSIFLHAPMTCAQQGGGVPHPAQRPKRHQTLSLIQLISLCCIFSSVVPFQESFSLPPITPISPPLPPTPLPPPAPLSGQFPPAPTTVSRLAPQEPSPTPHTGLTVIVQQYTVRPCYGST